MNVIICGAGDLGYNIARYLIEEGNNITVIDTDPQLIAKINDNLDCRGIVGHASAPSTWEKVGAEGADIAIAVTRDDEINMIACKVAHHLFGVNKSIARIREQSYLNPKWRALFDDSSMPIDLIISPEKEIAQAILRRVHAPGASDIMPLNTPDMSLVGVKVKGDCPILEDNIERVVANHEELSFNIMAVSGQDGISPPNPSDVVSVDDEVYFICPNDKILPTLALFGHEDPDARNVLLVGGGTIGSYLAEELIDDCKVTIIENDPKVARKLAEKLPRSVVINGDALKLETLQESALHQKDICISVSDSDEVNLISGLHAHQVGIERTICLLDDGHYETLAHNGGVDVTVHPMEITGSVILQSMRHGVVKTLHSLQENTAEIVELEVSKTAEVVGMKLSDIKLFRGSYIGMVFRNHDNNINMILPHDGLELQALDRVVMLLSPSNMNRIIQIFAEHKNY